MWSFSAIKTRRLKIPVIKKQVQMMGTTIDIELEDDRYLPDVLGLLELYNHRFSANDESSELSEINRQAGLAPVKVHEELFELIAIGKAHSLAENSMLNIAIGPVVKAWRIGFPEATLPSPELLQEKLKLTNPENIILDGGQVFLKEKGMELDLGALAKGYIADKIMSELREKGVKTALINLGGNVLVMGERDWTIGLQNPVLPRGNHVGLLTARNQSLVTSGIYERTFEKASKSYHHLFDRQTGYPIETEMASLTIVAEKSLDGEIWTSRLFGRALDKVLFELSQNPLIEGVIITKIGQVIVSPGLKQNFRNI